MIELMACVQRKLDGSLGWRIRGAKRVPLIRNGRVLRAHEAKRGSIRAAHFRSPGVLRIGET
jgi:hypothetical protein